MLAFAWHRTQGPRSLQKTTIVQNTNAISGNALAMHAKLSAILHRMDSSMSSHWDCSDAKALYASSERVLWNRASPCTQWILFCPRGKSMRLSLSQTHRISRPFVDHRHNFTCFSTQVSRKVPFFCLP